MNNVRGRRLPEVNAWPGWVDALSSIIIVVIFVLMIFIVAQYFLQTALLGRDDALQRLGSRIETLTSQLAVAEDRETQLRGELERVRSKSWELEGQITGLRSQISDRDQEIERLREQQSGLRERLSISRGQVSRAEAEIAHLNARTERLVKELTDLNALLEAKEAENKAAKVEITNLSQRLNEALATKVAELARFRSEFFGRLRELLGERSDVTIVGDRFVFQSEVLFPSGSAKLSDGGQEQLVQLAQTLKELTGDIPDDINWILRIDGHTDRLPIRNEQFPSNWELSTARALSVLRFLEAQGIPPERMAATGFGEFQPIAKGNDETSLARNRRIELKLDNR